MIEDRLLNIAKEFIDSENHQLIGSEYRYGLGELTEFLRCYYFDFKVLNVAGEKYAGEPLAGAPGFVISKTDFKIEIISFGRLAELNLYEDEVDRFLKILTDLKKDCHFLSSFKSVFNLTSKELLEIKKKIDNDNIDRKMAESLYFELTSLGRNSV